MLKMCSRLHQYSVTISLTLLLYQMRFDLPKLSLKYKLKLMLNTNTFYGNLQRNKKVCRVHFDGKLYKKYPMCEVLSNSSSTGNQSMVLINTVNSVA